MRDAGYILMDGLGALLTLALVVFVVARAARAGWRDAP